MGRIFRELLIVGCFLWCIALLCPMDRAFLARRLIVSEDSLIVSADSLIVSAGGIRGWLRVVILSRKRRVFCYLEEIFIFAAENAWSSRTGREPFWVGSD